MKSTSGRKKEGRGREEGREDAIWNLVDLTHVPLARPRLRTRAAGPPLSSFFSHQISSPAPRAVGDLEIEICTATTLLELVATRHTARPALSR